MSETATGSNAVLPRRIVGLGASAGGLEALTEFFENMPNDAGLGFIVVQHLSPDYKSLMGELLSKHTRMSIVIAKDGMRVAANRIHLIPPKKNMAILNGKLLLSEQEDRHQHGVNFPIDIFMRSLAEDAGERSIAIILSGTGSDGTRGVRAIKEAGGMVMVQDEQSAKFDGMPRSATATGLADYILPPQQMPGQLVRYLDHPLAEHQGEGRDSSLAGSMKLTRLITVLRRNTGIDFSQYKPATVIRRIERRMGINQIEEFDAYCQLVEQSRHEATVLFRELLIGVTKFFRDPDAFDVLEQRVLPTLLKQAVEDHQIRAWVAGCSTGEEAYSIAMLLMEFIDSRQLSIDVKIFATDVDPHAIEFAGNGVYPESIAADVCSERLKKYFVRTGGSYRVSSRLRESVVFARHNILADPPFTKLDLITCRNLLIYIQPMMQKKILSLFRFALRPHGVLFLGTSETVGDLADSFEPISSKWNLYKVRSTDVQFAGQSHLLMDTQFQLQSDMRNVGRSGSNQSDRMLSEMHKQMISDFVPPCVVINGQNQVIHVQGKLDHLLRIPHGPFTNNLLQMVDRELSVALATGINKARQSGEQVVYHDVVLRTDSTLYRMNLQIQPVSEPSAFGDLQIIYFQQLRASVEPSGGSDPGAYQLDDQALQRINDLEHELQHTRENLQATIEELETANEELQATNEELLAANEELQSTNEELHSVNEELYTVNAEYHSKIQELIELNNDLDNLLANMDFGIIFLDEQLCVRKFNNAVSESIHLVSHDIGRPVTHIAGNLINYQIATDARQVIQTHQSVMREVESREGRWYQVRLIPYTIDSSQIAGVIVILTDISRQRAELDQRDRHQDLLQAIFRTSRRPMVLLNPAEIVQGANDALAEMLEVSLEALVESPIRRWLEPVESVEDNSFPTGRWRWLDGSRTMQVLVVGFDSRQGDPYRLLIFDGCPDSGEPESECADG